MRRGYKVTLGILTIMILITMTIGTSYSFYSVSDEQDESNLINSTCFKIEFNDTNGSSRINLGNAYPIDDGAALNKTPYTFTVRNTCTALNSSDNVKYKVLLGKSNSAENSENDLTTYLKYKIVESTSNSLETGEIKKLSDAKPYEGAKPQNVSNAYELVSGELSVDGTKTYNLYLWIDSTAGNGIMGYSFNGEIFVYADI